ncbi:unnamed protein product [Lactuca saligna]|uniref:Uncharacterized protein n=1 Tax=Lactuca saligna TaxID=75948 RepID=A0AA35ZJV4_LACSI|nr:unnamed protein product [Lactuca saligna]
MIRRKYELVLRGSNRGIWVDDDEIEEEGDLKTTKKKNISSSFRYQSCFTDETHSLLISFGDGGGNSSRRQRWCRSSTLATTTGGNGSFAASISCSDKLDDDGGERSWVWWMEEVAVTTIFVGGGKSSSGRGLVRQPYDTSSLFRLTGKDKGRDGVGYGMRFDGDSR